MKNIFNKRIINRIFEIGILIKSFFGIFEIFGGILLAISGHKIIDNLIIFITQQEIMEDPNDFIANYLIKLSHSFSIGAQYFAIVYLIFHGIINITLAVALLKKKIRVYPWAIASFSAFILYQAYKFYNTHSILLLFLTLFDVFIISITLLEYKKLASQKPK